MKVDCNGCGSSLSIGDATRFVTCVKCSSRLEVKRGEASVFTEVLPGGADDDAASSKNTRAPVDASMEGGAPVPTAGMGMGEAIVRVIVGLVMIASDLYWWITDPSLQSLYGRILLLGAGVWMVVVGVWRAVSIARGRLKAA